ncbi:MAG: T9SS type A sorting domain-containing protein [Bacteroidales bacterium]|nr:T9SS type A sorting domain-containing protein [Bacteroidales bacterium]
MKNLYSVFLTATAVAFVFMMAGFGGGDNSDYPVGAPPGYTNSPYDGKNCTHCMGGTATPLADMITSDIPAEGYQPGVTYNILVTATGEGNKGFEISPMNSSGYLLGTLIAGTDSKLVGSDKYITHTLAEEGSTKSWLFQWTAPSPGVGTITFYGSIAIGQLTTKTTTMVVTQNTLGINDLQVNAPAVFPNPVKDHLTVTFTTYKSEPVTIQVISLRGEVASALFSGNRPGGFQSITSPVDLASGLYLLKFETGTQRQLKKIVVQ